MTNNQRLLTLILASFLSAGCATDDTQSPPTGAEQQAAALGAGPDACMTSCTEERGIEPERCEELCSEPNDASCYTGCIDAGGTQESCRMECYATADCHAQCLAEGGDDESCRPECIRDEQAGPTSDVEGCIGRCIEGGGDQASCRELCSQASDDSRPAETACSRVSTETYDSCMADGGESEACRQAAADAHEACTSAD
jgi:hypothetical protein